MKFDIFVIPFSAGFAFMLSYIVIKLLRWIYQFSSEDRFRLIRHVFNFSVIKSLKEITREGLLHFKIYKANPLLGYMHMSLAYGWFLLMFFGNLQVKIFSPNHFNMVYYPIFLKFFEPIPPVFRFDKVFNFLMDFSLALVLSGVLLAITKRFALSLFGLKHATNHSRGDKIALTVLWLIFPLRLIAESLSSSIYNNGSFLTGSLGKVFGALLPTEYLFYPAWWAYSISLGIFFVALPFSRYMHIPSEIILIFFRNAGIKPARQMNAFTETEINACSRCGICIDSCQLASSAGITNIQPSYFIRDVRYGHLKNNVADNCLTCGRCNIACPVGIDSVSLRLIKRTEYYNQLSSNYSYLPLQQSKKPEVLYFAGCMTHLTPTIKNSMTEIFNRSGVSWDFLDKDGTICCGRPLLLSGQLESARVLMDKNSTAIQNSGAKTLVTSCPICLKAFREEYHLDIEVLHHSQYIVRLIENEKIRIRKSSVSASYHDPCELGRGLGIYLEPRLAINHAVELIQNKISKEKSLCCGGSLGNFYLDKEMKKQITSDALKTIYPEHAEMLITACPLCLKTFKHATNKPVLDIAKIIADQMIELPYEEPKISARKPLETAAYVKNHLRQ
jgi:Fe-S oxidoreductase